MAALFCNMRKTIGEVIAKTVVKAFEEMLCILLYMAKNEFFG